tara:strand:- start:436 stop:678 length:243 start_codon:yes stop_codon:yes gene_type:complete
MDTLKELVARVLNVDKNEINDESSPDNLDSWDSFNGLLMVSELEKNFDVKFTMEEILAVTKYKDIKESLRNHGVTQGLDD